MKRLEVTEKKIGENTFYLKPFPAFVAANISGELASVLTPLLGGAASVVGAAVGSRGEENKNFMDMEISDAIPAMTTAFSSLSGDKLERLMRKLLIENENISVCCEVTDNETKLMTKDIADEVFCGEVQDMFVLCYEVIRLNFKGFFKKFGALSGNLKNLLDKVPTTPNTDTSISADLPN